MHEGSWYKWWDSSKHYTAFQEALNSYPPIFSPYMFHQNPELEWSSEQQGSNKRKFSKRVGEKPKGGDKNHKKTKSEISIAV